MNQKKRSSRLTESTVCGSYDKLKGLLVSNSKILEARSCTKSCTVGQVSSWVSTDYSDPNDILSNQLNPKAEEEDLEDNDDLVFLEIRGQLQRVSVADPIKFELSCNDLASKHHMSRSLMLSIKIVIVNGLYKKNCLFESTYNDLMKQYTQHKISSLL